MDVVAVAALFRVLGSVTLAVTFTVLVTEGTAAWSGVTLMSTWTEADGASVPSAAVTVLPEFVGVVPLLAVAPRNESPAGRASLSVTPGADDGPLLVTVAR